MVTTEGGTSMQTISEAEQFFYENAGYSYKAGEETADEGRRRGAVEYARAEANLRAAIEAGTTRVRREPDEDTYQEVDGWAEELQEEAREKLSSGVWEARGCILERWNPAPGVGWEHVASVWSVVSTFDATDTYPRVIEAELADEAGLGR